MCLRNFRIVVQKMRQHSLLVFVLNMNPEQTENTAFDWKLESAMLKCQHLL